MKKRSTSKDDQDIPEYKREQLGVGVRGKYYKQFMQGSNLVLLTPELAKIFPTSEVVNSALESLVDVARSATGKSRHSSGTPLKRRTS
ncbi:MAG: hypothetical protein WBQ69_03450 [Gallionella sp.]